MLELGAGIFSRYVGSGLTGKPGDIGKRVDLGLHLSLALGGVLVVLASVGSIFLVLIQLAGQIYPDMFREYLLYTGHGRWTLLRLALVSGLLALGLGRRLPLASERTLHLALSFALLVSVSALSHAGASGNRVLLFADLGHLGAAALWAGSVIALALLPVWSTVQRPALQETLKRVSGAGLLSVGLLFVTGLYASSVHLTSSAELLRTNYGLALFCKVLLVALIVGIAAGNRWLLLPLLTKGGAPALKRTVRLEALLLVATLALSGTLTSLEPEAVEHLHAHSGHGGEGLEVTTSDTLTD